MNTTSWTIRDAQISARGAKYCLIEDLKPKSNDNKIRFSIGTKEIQQAPLSEQALITEKRPKGKQLNLPFRKKTKNLSSAYMNGQCRIWRNTANACLERICHPNK